MRRLLPLLATLFVLIATPATAARQTTLEDPALITVPANRPEAEVARAVAFALAAKGWVVESEQAGRIVASYSPATHVARVVVQRSAERIGIRYLSSVNLNFEQDGDEREIHPSYNKWVAALHDEIEKTLTQGVPQGAVLPTVQGRKTTNPPPSEKFAGFGRFELVPASMGAPYAGQPANGDALRNIRHALNTRLGPLLAQWNATAAPTARLLRIEPAVDHVRFIGTAARVFAGRMAGRSSVILKVRYVDVATGSTVADPEFYLFSEAANGFSMSARDYKMLENIGTAVADYTLANYDRAVGGGTTAPDGVKAE